MTRLSRSALKLTAICALALPMFAAAEPHVQITEWIYSGGSGEFVEFTNLGSSSVDFTGWVYDDESRLTSAAAGAFSLSDFGAVAPGESVVITEAAAATFRAVWGLAPSVKVIGGYTNNLGRNDEINLFDAAGKLVDRLRYGDSSYAPGTIRTQNASGNPLTLAALDGETVQVGQWQLARIGDGFHTVESADLDLGNPGTFALAPVPEPATWLMLAAGLLGVCGVARRRAV